MRILQSRAFQRQVRRLHRQEKLLLDQEIRAIAANPLVGQEKRGVLKGIFVHKFKLHSTQYLLAYRMPSPDLLELIMLGPHENYYRTLTTHLKKR